MGPAIIAWTYTPHYLTCATAGLETNCGKSPKYATVCYRNLWPLIEGGGKWKCVIKRNYSSPTFICAKRGRRNMGLIVYPNVTSTTVHTQPGSSWSWVQILSIYSVSKLFCVSLRTNSEEKLDSRHLKRNCHLDAYHHLHKSHPLNTRTPIRCFHVGKYFLLYSGQHHGFSRIWDLNCFIACHNPYRRPLHLL
jgi:hypothetical protein